MPKINIQRTTGIMNKMRDFKILVDGTQVSTISSGETNEFDISPGRHRILCKVDWCTSPEIYLDFEEQDTKYLKISNYKHENWLTPYSFFIIAIHLILSRVFKFEFLIFLLVPSFIIFVYYVTIGHKKYLRLTEVSFC
ncbi:MAG: hypothetical protein WAT79_05040 [Saprospiraceae bacterium]